MKNYFITNDKKKAQKEIKKLINKVIISDIIKEEHGYRITRLSQKEYYKNSVEAQADMPKYLDHLLNALEEDTNKKEILTNKQEEDNQKAKIFEDLSKSNK